MRRSDELIYWTSWDNQPNTIKRHDRRLCYPLDNSHTGVRILRHEQGTVITDCGISLLLHLFKIFPQTPFGNVRQKRLQFTRDFSQI